MAGRPSARPSASIRCRGSGCRSGRARTIRGSSPRSRRPAIATSAGTWTGSTGRSGRRPRRWSRTSSTGPSAHGDGAIVLCHGWPDPTHEALPGIVARLRDAGAEFVRVDVAPIRPRMTEGRGHVLGVDGGNSKTDVALVAADGRLLAAIRGGTISHQQVGLETGRGPAGRSWSAAARARAGLGPDDLAGPGRLLPRRRGLAGRHRKRLTAAFAARPLARAGHVLNDAFAPVRARLRPGLGRRHHLRRRRQRGRHRAGRSDGPVRGARSHLGRLGRRRGCRDGRSRGRRPGSRRPRAADHPGAARPGPLRAASAASTSPTPSSTGRSALRELRHLSPVVFGAAAEGDAVAQRDRRPAGRRARRRWRSRSSAGSAWSGRIRMSSWPVASSRRRDAGVRGADRRRDQHVVARGARIARATWPARHRGRAAGARSPRRSPRASMPTTRRPRPPGCGPASERGARA